MNEFHIKSEISDIHELVDSLDGDKRGASFEYTDGKNVLIGGEISETLRRSLLQLENQASITLLHNPPSDLSLVEPPRITIFVPADKPRMTEREAREYVGLSPDEHRRQVAEHMPQPVSTVQYGTQTLLARDHGRWFADA